MNSDDKKGWVALFIAAIVIALCVLSLCGCDTATAEETSVKHASGMPLDAISYDPPAWMPDCIAAYHVTDRIAGCSWWLLALKNARNSVDYVVMPIEGSYDPT